MKLPQLGMVFMPTLKQNCLTFQLSTNCLYYRRLHYLSTFCTTGAAIVLYIHPPRANARQQMVVIADPRMFTIIQPLCSYFQLVLRTVDVFVLQLFAWFTVFVQIVLLLAIVRIME